MKLYISPATVEVLETFLETILGKAFQFFRRILNYISSITKNAVPSAQISVDGRGKNQLGPGQKGVVDVPMLSIFFTGKKSLINP